MFVLVAGVLAGAIAGGAVGASAAAPDQVPAKPAGPGADFPDHSRAYLSEVTVSEVTDWMKGNAYECEKPKKAEGLAAKREVWCWPPDGTSASAYVIVFFDGDRQVRSTEATCEPGPLSPPGYCQDLFQYMVDLAFPQDSKSAKQARRWTVRNADNDAATVIGGVELSVSLQDHSVEVYPAN